MSGAELLEQRVVRAVRDRVGHTLESVTYRCLEHEAGPSSIHDTDFYMGGELLLQFSSGPLYLSWDENTGWGESDFSVQASHISLFIRGWNFESFAGALVSHWRPHVESELLGSQVLGWDGVPYAVLFSFSLGSVVVGSSCQTRLGDGDDFIVRDASYLESLPALDVLWSSAPTE